MMAVALGIDNCGGCWAVMTELFERDGLEVRLRSVGWKLRYAMLLRIC